MKSGMLAANATFDALTSPQSSTSSSQQLPVDLSSYEKEMQDSYVWDELYSSRNIRPGYALHTICHLDLLMLYSNSSPLQMYNFSLSALLNWSAVQHQLCKVSKYSEVRSFCTTQLQSIACVL